MQTETVTIDPVAIVKAYDLHNMSAKVGVLVGMLSMFRAFGFKEPDWAGDDLLSLINLMPHDNAGAVVDKAFDEYEQFLNTCETRNCRMRPVGWDYNIGI